MFAFAINKARYSIYTCTLQTGEVKGRNGKGLCQGGIYSLAQVSCMLVSGYVALHMTVGAMARVLMQSAIHHTSNQDPNAWHDDNNSPTAAE